MGRKTQKASKRTKAQRANDRRLKLPPEAYDARSAAAKVQRWAEDVVTENLGTALRVALQKRDYKRAVNVAGTISGDKSVEERVRVKAREAGALARKCM